MLGETFELVLPGKYQFIAEQVTHHPPVSAFNIQGDAGYLKYATFNTKTSFGMTGTMGFSNIFNEYTELLGFDEKFEFTPPALVFHNLIMGQPYIDINSTAQLRNLAKPTEKYVNIQFHGRGWTGGAANHHRVSGEVFSAKGKVALTFEGRWSDSITLTDVRTNESEIIWTKHPYPDHWDEMYGMTRFNLQLNYLPSSLKPLLPPTDSRFRPDQRALENGDMELAASEKHRLEEK